MCDIVISACRRYVPGTLALAAMLSATSLQGQTTPVQHEPAKTPAPAAQPGAAQPAVKQPPQLPPGVGATVLPGAHGAAGTTAPELTKEVPSFNGAGIVFDTPRYNFGRVMAGGNVTHEYWFTNPGKEKLQILAVQPGCGCTTTGAWDREIPPGESGRIPISVATGKFSGHIAKVVTVTTNVKEMPSVQLHIEGDIWTPVQVTPSNLAFGQIVGATATEPRTLEATIENNMDQPLEIKSVTCANQSIRPETTPDIPGKKYKLKVTALPPFQVGNFFGEVKIQTNNTAMPEVSVMVSGYVSPPVQVVPPMVQLRPTTSETYQQQVYVRNNMGKAMELTDVKCTDDKLTLTVQPQPNIPGYYIVVIKVPSNYSAPPNGAEITMKTDVKSAENLSVRVYQSPPQIAPPVNAHAANPAVLQAGGAALNAGAVQAKTEPVPMPGKTPTNGSPDKPKQN